nr:hypothetical protein [Tanacetum cinerariifolium]
MFKNNYFQGERESAQRCNKARLKRHKRTTNHKIDFDLLEEYWSKFVVAPDGTVQELMMLKQRRDAQINQARMRKIEEDYHGSNNGLKIAIDLC